MNAEAIQCPTCSGKAEHVTGDTRWGRVSAVKCPLCGYFDIAGGVNLHPYRVKGPGEGGGQGARSEFQSALAGVEVPPITDHPLVQDDPDEA